MRKKPSASQRIRSLIDSGYNNKAIIEKLKCKPQAVYNIRYQLNKARGLGSIGALPNPTDGIGAPPKRTRKIRAGTGIVNVPKVGDNVGGLVLTEMNDGALRWMPPPLVPMPEPALPVTMVEKPTLWQRVKGWFRG
jgi:hypothetical protein